MVHDSQGIIGKGKLFCTLESRGRERCLGVYSGD